MPKRQSLAPCGFFKEEQVPVDHNKIPNTLRWEDKQLYLLDQTVLPLEIREERQEKIEQVWYSIKKLKVRGAPAIGVAGAYGLVMSMCPHIELSEDDFMKHLRENAEYLNSSRPTAVNLSWGLNRIVKRAEAERNKGSEWLLEAIADEAQAIHTEDIKICDNIGTHGKDLIKEGCGVLTHCNAGALATTGIGTATAPMYKAHNEGRSFRVYSDETRPLLQGARLTSWELQHAGIDVTVICDSAAASIMAQGKVDIVIVGADRVCANGDVTNKIGTYQLAIAAKYHNIPFYVACPSSTLDFGTECKEGITIEQRSPDEVTSCAGVRTAPEGIQASNAAFDTTPSELVSGIITEKGLVQAPFKENLQKLFL